jgi:hypothetical protein
MTVALSGVGGDELFAGYPFFAQYLQLQRIKGWWTLPAGLRQMLANTWAGRQAQGKKARMKQLLELPSMSIDHSYPVFRQMLSPSPDSAIDHPGGQPQADYPNYPNYPNHPDYCRSGTVGPVRRASAPALY